jgi:membrane protease YdiL (CAAX protease family)
MAAIIFLFMAQSESSCLTRTAEDSLSHIRVADIHQDITRYPAYGLWIIALAYLVLLTLAEIITTYSESWVGLAFHGLVFMALLLHSSLWAQNSLQRFLLALSLAPLIRVLSLTLPLPSIPIVYWYVVVGVPLFLAAFVTARLVQVNGSMLGITGRNLPLQFLVALSGFGLGYIEYLILRPVPLVSEPRLNQILVPSLILLIFTGLLEEIIFRGLMQYTSICVYGRSSIFYVAGLVSVLHIGYRSMIDLVFVFLVAIYFAWIRYRSGSIFGVILAHGITNIALYLIFPFILTAPVKVPDQKLPQQAVLLAPVAAQQITRQLLPPILTPYPPVSPSLVGTAAPEITAINPMTFMLTPTPCAVPVVKMPSEVRLPQHLQALLE